MKVLTEQPVRFATGGTLAPEDLNRVMLYAQDAVADVAQRRWARSTLTLPFVRTVGDPLTQAITTDELSWRFICPVECVLERAFLSGNLTCTGQLQFALTNAAGATPNGATIPYLSTDGSVGAATVDTEDVNVDRVVLTAGVEYKITVSGTTFSLARADVTLHVAVDRWASGGTLDVPSFAPTLHAAAGSPNATTVNANTAALTTQTNKFNARRGMTPFLLTTTDLGVGASMVFDVPLWESGRARATVARIYVGAAFSVLATGSVTAVLKSAAGVTRATATGSLGAGAFLTTPSNGDSGALSLSMVGIAGVTTTPASDNTITLTNSSTQIAKRLYALVWLDWL